GETPIETVSISTPLAPKKPFLVATIPGHIVAVGETWPKETLLADCAGAPASAIACSASTARRATLSPGRIIDLCSANSALEVVVPAKAGTHIPEASVCSTMGPRLRGDDS